MPITREILFAIFCTCGFQLMCSSSVNPKKLNSETRSSGSEFNSSAGTRCSIFLCGWWKIMNLVLLTFTNNLFIRSHSCTHESSLYLACNYLSALGLKLIHVCKRAQEGKTTTLSQCEAVIRNKKHLFFFKTILQVKLKCHLWLLHTSAQMSNWY